jgi:hypothetical protein
VEEGEAVLENVVLGREGGLQVVLGNPQVLQHHHPYHLQVPHLSINHQEFREIKRIKSAMCFPLAAVLNL